MMIEAEQLTRYYGPTLAVDDVSFAVDTGQVAALLGPNGAGKSTTLRMLTGCLPPTAGVARIARYDVHRRPAQAKRALGYLPEHDSIYPELTVDEYLDFRGRLMGMARIDRRRRIGEVANRVNLAPLRRRTVGRLSKGNRRRLGLAQALLHEPPVLILDEPTAGFDPTQAAGFRTLLAELKQHHCILLSTHLLPEVEQTADQLLIMAGGRLRAAGTADALRREAAQQARITLRTAGDAQALSAALDPLVQSEALQLLELADDPGGCHAQLQTAEPTDMICARIGDALAAADIAVHELARHEPSLESLFVRATA